MAETFDSLIIPTNKGLTSCLKENIVIHIYMKKKFFYPLILIVLILPICLTFFAHKNQVSSLDSGYFTSLKNSLSTSQLSYFNRLDVGVSNLQIARVNQGNNPSNLSENLFIGDTLTIDSVGESDTYILENKVSDQLYLDRNITANQGAMVIATRSAVHTISFMPQYDLDNGLLMFLIQATDLSDETPDDGIPDQGGFDRNGVSLSDISCPGGGVAGDANITTIEKGLASDGTYFQVFCGGVNLTSGTMAEIVIGKEDGNKIINPSPGRNHNIGEASTLNSGVYNFGIAVMDELYNLVGIDMAKVILTENVLITAVVEPIITFTIGTSGATTVGSILCGSPIGKSYSGYTQTNVTPSYVNFGQLYLDAHNDLAQRLSIITNTTNGYVIQGYENKPLTAGVDTILPDTDCGGNCSVTTAGAWTDTSNSGFGYSLEVGTTTGNGANVSLGIGTTGHYKAFGVGTSNAQALLSRTDVPTGTDSIYVCYRIVADSGQLPGTYENSISYIATVVF